MGSDNRDAPGDHIDNLTGIGKRSDTTILLHLSGDRQRAYGVSIPRDSVVDRPLLRQRRQGDLARPPPVLWNDAFNIGGPACTIEQFEQLTHVPRRPLHRRRLRGLQVDGRRHRWRRRLPPAAVVDPIARHHAARRHADKLTGTQALNYVRERTRPRQRLGHRPDEAPAGVHRLDGSARPSAANTLANPIAVTGFLDAATKSLTVDEDLGSLPSWSASATSSATSGSTRSSSSPRRSRRTRRTSPTSSGRPAAATLWHDLRGDRPLPASLLSGSVDAGHVPGVSHRHRHHGSDAYGLCT